MAETIQAAPPSAASEIRAALEQIEMMLSRRQPGKVSDQCSRATSHLVCLRDRMIEDEGQPAPGQEPSLARVNSLLSALAGIEFPLAGTHWKRIEQVRDALRQLLPA